MLSYWSERAFSANHPILKRRYADLVWDFSKKITGKGADHRMVGIIIDSTVEIANNRLCEHEVFEFENFRRALDLSRSHRDELRQKICKNSLIDFEERIGVLDKIGLWGNVFDFLVSEKLVPITQDEESKIVKDIEEKWSMLSSEKLERRDPWAVESAALRLLQYFQKKGDADKVDALLRSVEEAFDSVSDGVEPMQLRGWLRKVYDLYRRYSRNADADRIMMKINGLASAVKNSLKDHSVSASISSEEVDKYIDKITTGGLYLSLIKMTVKYTPRKDAVVDLLRDLSARAPLSFMINQEILNEKGEVVASVGPIDEDLEGHVVRQITQQLSTSSPFLRMIIDKIVEKYGLDADGLIDYLGDSVLIEEDKRGLLLYSIRKYFSGDLVAFAHVVIPVIENAIRVLLKFVGGKTHKMGRGDQFFNRTLDEMLRDPLFESVFANDQFLKDVPLYFRVVLTDQRGWNFRNQLSHGLISSDDINQGVADRLLHLILILGSLQEEVNVPQEGPAQA
jgi:hypothetical protein